VKIREAIEGEAAAAFGQWAETWAEGLESVLDGDPRGAPRLAAAGRRCVDHLSACLEAWQELRAPARMARLVDLGAASFRLQLALVRGTLAFVEQADYSALEPLAGLAARLAALSRTIAAESVRLDRSGAGAWAGSNAR
jgi:hypothetical protein